MRPVPLRVKRAWVAGMAFVWVVPSRFSRRASG